MRKELGKNFDFHEAEPRIYANWLAKNFFHAEIDKNKKPYTIMMPPPNITGVLHMGHALDCTIQDIIIRFKRMQGFNVMWLPGTDHASISTEVKVTNRLRAKGIEKEKIGREKFLQYVFDWKNKYGNTIVNQIKRLGCSCDWERLSFTMDEKISRAVNHVFVSLYNQGLIYKGEKLINWCTQCKTTISDAEVNHEDKDGFLWYFKYPIKNTNRFIEFATTRPETLLGDTAIAVNPNDDRYKDLVGLSVTVPFANREIPIITDNYVDMTYGTGVVKITPAHDPNDYEVGKRHGLDFINIFTDDGFLNKNAGQYCGLDKITAREKILDDMKSLGLFIKSEKIIHAVGVHERCNTIIEPLIKPQWFMKTHDLTKPAIDVFKSEELKFYPKRFGKIYLQWLEKLGDWCISRQLWWGHRIPAYYCRDCENIMIREKQPGFCDKCSSENIYQDEDVLDTWFSSALWPFATLGWPENTADLDYFYPTDILVTSYDIILFWVVRMVFSGLKHTGKLPFKDVLIHGLIRDNQGRKMSKSLDNGVDPLDIIDKYGCDVLRMTLITGSSPGNDLKFYPEKLESNKTFVNKLWNAAKFILMYDENPELSNISNIKDIEFDITKLELEDKWILSKLNLLVKEVTEHMENYDHGIAFSKIFDFVWNEFCDWYIEFSKFRLYNNRNKITVLCVLKFVFVNCLKLLHPFMPFVTEELFLALQDSEPTIMKTSWPENRHEFGFMKESECVEFVKTVIKSVRNIRTEMNVHPAKRTKLFVVTENQSLKDIFIDCEEKFSLCGVNRILFKEPETKNNISVVLPDCVLYIPSEELIDIKSELKRLDDEKTKILYEIQRAQNKLANQSFVEKAPKELVEREKEKLDNHKKSMQKITEKINTLKGGV